MNEPRWDEIPTDDEILFARSVLKRMSRAIPPGSGDGDVWGGLVEARRMLTVSVHYLASHKGHTRHYLALWHAMLRQDR